VLYPLKDTSTHILKSVATFEYETRYATGGESELTLEHANCIVLGSVRVHRGGRLLPCWARLAPGIVIMLDVAKGGAGVASKPDSSAGKCEGSKAYSTYWFTPN